MANEPQLQPSEEIAEQVGQTALEQVVKQTPAEQTSDFATVADAAIANATAGQQKPLEDQHIVSENNNDAKEDKNPSSLPKQNDSKNETNNIKQALPAEEKKKKDGRWATANPIVKTLVIIGVATVSLGLIIAFFSLVFGVVLMAIGSIAIIACVFLPIGMDNN